GGALVAGSSHQLPPDRQLRRDPGTAAAAHRGPVRPQGGPQMIAYLSTLVVLIAISALVGLALNLQWGVAGLVNFGVVGFVALGAYATALLAPAFGWYGAMIAAAALCVWAWSAPCWRCCRSASRRTTWRS